MAHDATAAVGAIGEAEHFREGDAAHEPISLDRLILGVTTAVWVLHGGHVIIRSYLMQRSDDLGSTLARLATTATGIVVTLCIWLILRRLQPRGLGGYLLGAGTLSLFGCAVVTLTHETWMTLWSEYYASSPGPMFNPIDLIIAYPGYLWIFLTWSGLCATLAAGHSLRTQMRRAADAEALAQKAQLAALRHQLQPHFLFNALNAVATLVHARRNDEAEGMVLQLAGFLKLALEAAPRELSLLSRELEAQRLYLDIEKVRFSDRLLIVWEADPDTQNLLVPSLVLQPLVENAIKHGLGLSVDPVTLRIGAARRADRLHVWVEDDAVAGSPPGPGLRLGLQNVSRRLALLYGGEGRLDAGPSEPGWRSEIIIPCRPLL